MIRLTSVSNSGTITHYVSPRNIARVSEASISSQWHGIQSIVRTFDGDLIECCETARDINAQVDDAMRIVEISSLE